MESKKLYKFVQDLASIHRLDHLAGRANFEHKLHARMLAVSMRQCRDSIMCWAVTVSQSTPCCPWL